MTEIQQYIWGALGVISVLALKYLFEFVTGKIKKGVSLEEEAKGKAIIRIEKEVTQLSLSHRALVIALASMNSVPELEIFSKQFKSKYVSVKQILEKDPNADII